MKGMFLVQRLKHPTRGIVHRVFGGGMLGLTPEQWDFVDPVFEIDYMGAAEYEVGVFPRAMFALGEEKGGLSSFCFAVERANIAPNPMRPLKGRSMPEKPTEPATIYVVCRTAQASAAERAIRALLGEKSQSTLMDTFIHRTLDPFNDWDRHVVGWFDVENGIFFFTDKPMWKAVSAWFDLEAKDVVVDERPVSRAQSGQRKEGVRAPRDHKA